MNGTPREVIPASVDPKLLEFIRPLSDPQQERAKWFRVLHYAGMHVGDYTPLCPKCEEN